MRNIWRNSLYQCAFFFPIPASPARLPFPASACDRMRSSISFGIAGLSHVHYDAVVAATAATATAACNLEAENRENRRVKMKRGSSQGKWGNVFSTHIYIHSFCTRACTRAKQSLLVRKQLAPEGSLPHFRPFIPLTVFPLCLSLSLSRGESPCRSCLRIRSDLKRLRCRKTTCIRPSRGVNWTLSRQTIRLGEITSQLFSFASRGWMAESIECGLLSIALYSSAADAAFLPFYCATGESFFKDRKKKTRSRPALV